MFFPGSGWGSGALSPFFSLLSFLRKGVLFHHEVLVPFGSGSGSGACFPSSLFFLFSGMAFCSTMISWFLVVPALVPVLVPLLLSSFFSQDMVFCFLVPDRVSVLLSLLLSSFFSQERGSVRS